jgi:predicted nucleic acid-binding protein
VESLLQRIGLIAKLVPDVPPVFSLPRDPDDALYVDLAVAMQAGFIVSRDKDLLSLMAEDAFRKTYPWLTVIHPVAFLSHVRTQVAKELGQE